jgi:hypothetical protein
MTGYGMLQFGHLSRCNRMSVCEAPALSEFGIGKPTPLGVISFFALHKCVDYTSHLHWGSVDP